MSCKKSLTKNCLPLFKAIFYRVLWGPSVNTTLERDGLELHSTPLPSSGIILTYIMNLMKWFQVGPEDDTPLLYHRMIEAFKWAYAYRSKLGDPTDSEYGESITKVKCLLLKLDFGLNKC